ncbi:MAG: hypothetical protein Tsb0027_10430 [Wenzhouxiangellaceae bacterium]
MNGLSTDYADYTEHGDDLNVVRESSDPKTYAIIACAHSVHRELGTGFLEAVYQEAMAIELSQSNIPFQREVSLAIEFKNQLLATSYKADLICFETVIVELKAIRQIGTLEQAQLLNYLKASGLKTGLILNFGAPSLQIKRMIH